MKVAGAPIETDSYIASSYTDAMHNLCIKCHATKAREIEGKEKLAECASCHDNSPPDDLKLRLKYDNLKKEVNRVILPRAFMDMENTPDESG